MTEIRTQLPEGVPCWVDLGVPDHRRAMDFYRAMFGWEFDEGPADTGHYTMCLLRGQPVAAVASPPGAETRASWWNTYISTDDVDAMAKRIHDAGGRLPMEPMDIMDAGRMATAEDPAGATFGLWQGDRHIGARIVNEPGSMGWSELRTPDSDPAKRFYLEVFGYEPESITGMDYTVLRVPGRENAAGGIFGTTDTAGPGGRPHWLTYFVVEDTDSAARTASQQGGSVHSEPEDSPYGRLAIVADPFGAAFAVIEFTAESGQGGQT